MDNQHIPDITPEQDHGKHNDLQHQITLETTEDAEELFLEGKNRMLDVNNWGKYSNSPTDFTLTDAHGKELHRKAHIGDLIRIALPAPGPKAGDGYDWVHIDTISYDDYPDTNSEVIAMTVRPTQAPDAGKEDTAHFFKDDATSTFSVQRTGSVVIASYHGRNEVPNTEADSLLDKARNVVVAVGAMIGLSEVQWKQLIKGFIELDFNQE